MKDKLIIFPDGDSFMSCKVCHEDTIKDKWCKHCIDLPDWRFTLNPVQTKVYNMLNENPNISFVVASKTGTGKTNCAYMAIKKHFENNPNGKVIWTNPLKQIAKEKSEELPTIFPDKRILQLTGDTIDDVGIGRKRDIAISKSDIIVTSQEMLDSLTRKPEIYPSIHNTTMLVIDEIHGIGDPGRGGKFDGAITRFLLKMKSLDKIPQVVALSATFDNISNLQSYFEQFLPKFVIVTSDFSPIKANIDPTIHTYSYKADDVILHILPHYMNNPGGILIMQLTIPGTKRICDTINNVYGPDIARTHFSEMELSDKDKNVLDFNTGTFKVLCSTPTLLAGVNVAATCIILDVSFFNPELMERDILPASAIKQASGRVGRPPRYCEGWVSYISHEDLADEAERIIRSRNIIYGALNSSLEQVINTEIAIKSLSIDELKEWYLHTYSAHSVEDTNYSNERFNNTIEFLIANHYIEKDNNTLVSTAKGLITSKSFIDPVYLESSIRVIDSYILNNSDISNTEQLIEFIEVLFSVKHSSIRWTEGKSKHMQTCFQFKWLRNKITDNIDWKIPVTHIQWAKTAAFVTNKLAEVLKQLNLDKHYNYVKLVHESLHYGVVPLPLVRLGNFLKYNGITNVDSKLLLYLSANGVYLSADNILHGPSREQFKSFNDVQYSIYNDKYTITESADYTLRYEYKLPKIIALYGNKNSAIENQNEEKVAEPEY